MRSYSNLSKVSEVRVRSPSPVLLHPSTGHYQSVPTVIVFTKYDLLVSMMRENLKEDHPNMDKDSLDSQSEEEALNAFEKCLESLRQTMGRFRIPMPPYARVSGMFMPMR